MDLSMYGKWAWIIGLVVLIVWALLGAFGVSTGFDETIGIIATILAWLGGILYLASMKDRTGFLIVALALWAVAPVVASWDLFGVGKYIAAFTTGASAAAAAGAAGLLLVVIYEWVMSFSSSK